MDSVTPAHTRPIPRALRKVAGVCAAIGLVSLAASLFLGEPKTDSVPAWLVLLLLVCPALVALAFGFREGRPWTRPLLVGVLLLASGGLIHVGVPVAGILVVTAAVVAGSYVYAAPEVCAYYRGLQRARR